VRHWQATAATYLLTAYSEGGKFEEAKELYRSIKEIASAMTGNLLTLHILARASVNLLVGFAKRGRMSQARLIYADLRRLTEQHPHDAELRDARMLGARNILSVSARLGRPDLSAYVELREFAMLYPNEPKIQEMRARAAYRLVESYLAVGKVREAEQTYRELCKLAADRPGHTQLALEKGQTASLLVDGMIGAGDIDRTGVIYSELRHTVTCYPDERELRQTFGRTTLKLMTLYHRAGRLEDVGLPYENLKVLSSQNPNDLLLVRIVTEANREWSKAAGLIRHNDKRDWSTNDRDLKNSSVLGRSTAPLPSGPAPAKVSMGRNDPCHCGSGKKFKRCHGRTSFT